MNRAGEQTDAKQRLIGQRSVGQILAKPGRVIEELDSIPGNGHVFWHVCMGEVHSASVCWPLSLVC